MWSETGAADVISYLYQRHRPLYNYRRLMLFTGMYIRPTKASPLSSKSTQDVSMCRGLVAFEDNLGEWYRARVQGKTTIVKSAILYTAIACRPHWRNWFFKGHCSHYTGLEAPPVPLALLVALLPPQSLYPELYTVRYTLSRACPVAWSWPLRLSQHVRWYWRPRITHGAYRGVRVCQVLAGWRTMSWGKGLYTMEYRSIYAVGKMC